MRAGLAELRGELQTGLAELRGELHTDLAEMGTKLRRDLGEELQARVRVLQLTIGGIGIGLVALNLVLKFLA